ncbi:uncharacterized protein HMPREF1541_04982 [Cyphellophora europaea CBS 101466]|uniref:Uncharacterized protein n=1 Tax=Cyphellophora europaea (strain CBS 101466) TaxID=1220924 RepID=W2RY35_CYPE1|nr:uncharacterized protein HMPREF1541_04982 [Cyphellophora europaea CBS 101466]ETN40703.1 hypothetical protein HMPREF1541_04982 [Cyphellophora europaea CBS 101466]
MAKKTSSKPMLLPVLIPIAIALGVYLLLFHLLIPTWRAHRERYRQYLPLHTSSQISSRLPAFLHPQTLSRGMHSIVLRIFFPSTWALSRYQDPSTSSRPNDPSSTTHRRTSTSSFDLDDESGEAMIGFDVPRADTDSAADPREANRRRRENMERFAGRNMAFARGMAGADDGIREGRSALHPERRLNRELEAGFMDDSEDDEEDDSRGVTVGRQSFSASR